MGPFSWLMVKLGLPAFTCPECGERAGTWNKTADDRFLGGFFGHGWECDECGWTT